MKHLKSYESLTDSDFKFNKGDKVICSNGTWHIENLIKGNEYIIFERKRFNGRNFYSILDNGVLITNKNKICFFGENVFVTPLEYNTNKYNI